MVEVVDMPASFRTEKGILIITVTGRWSLDRALEAQAESAEIVKRQDIRRILVDIRNADIEASTNDIFRFATSFADVFPKDTRHAVVFSPQTYSLEDATFGENVAINRGVLVKVFTQFDEARDWLLQEDCPP